MVKHRGSSEKKAAVRIASYYSIKPMGIPARKGKNLD